MAEVRHGEVSNICDIVKGSNTLNGDGNSTLSLDEGRRIVLKPEPLDQSTITASTSQSIDSFIKMTTVRQSRLYVGLSLALTLLCLATSSWVPMQLCCSSASSCSSSSTGKSSSSRTRGPSRSTRTASPTRARGSAARSSGSAGPRESLQTHFGSELGGELSEAIRKPICFDFGRDDDDYGDSRLAEVVYREVVVPLEKCCPSI